MDEIIKELKMQIVSRGIFHDYKLTEDYAKGVNGVVFFASATSEHRSPAKLALKTLLPENISVGNNCIKDLQKEFATWLMIPPHGNIIAGRRFKKMFFVSKTNLEDGTIRKRGIEIPIMEMEGMDGSLRDWINNERFSTKDRLIAIVYALNGLSHLYKNGIEGHGDLKPENLLYRDTLPELIHLGEAELKDALTMTIKVADFGLTDIWLDGKTFNKSLREYTAPERLGDKCDQKFIPEKSDMFSIGIIAAEIIQMRHPSSNLKKVKKSEGKWIRSIAEQSWDLTGIDSRPVRELVLNCLDTDPSKRPNAHEAIQVLTRELKELHQVDLTSAIELFNKKGSYWDENSDSNKREVRNQIEQLKRKIGLGPDEDLKTAAGLNRIISGNSLNSLYDIDDWSCAIELILPILKENKETNKEFYVALSKAKRNFIEVIGKMDSQKFKDLSKDIDLKAFEHEFFIYSDIVGRITRAIDVNFEQVYSGEWRVTDFCISAFASYMASLGARGRPTNRTEINYLNIAEELNQSCDAIYIEKAKYHWNKMRGIEGEVSPTDILQVLDGIKKARKFKTNWDGPELLLSEIKAFCNAPDWDNILLYLD